VLDALVRRRVVSREEAEKARSSMSWKRMTFRRALAYRGLVLEDLYAQIVKEDVVLEGVFELFLESGRRFKFLEGRPDLLPYDPDQVCAELRLNVTSFVLDASRRCDEWNRLLDLVGAPDV